MSAYARNSESQGIMCIFIYSSNSKIKIKLKLLHIWRLKFRSKMSQITDDSRRFCVSCCVVKLPFCILSASSSWTRLVFNHLSIPPIFTIKDPDEGKSFSMNLHLSTKLIVSVITHFCYSARFRRNSLSLWNSLPLWNSLIRFEIRYRLAPYLENRNNNSPLWKRVIAWERSRAASGYGIIWGTQIETNKRNLVRNVMACIGFNRTTDSNKI